MRMITMMMSAYVHYPWARPGAMFIEGIHDFPALAVVCLIPIAPF